VLQAVLEMLFLLVLLVGLEMLLVLQVVLEMLFLLVLQVE
jgi:hypothetical protein